MTRTTTIIIGAGQAGLAMSRCLSESASSTSCSNVGRWRDGVGDDAWVSRKRSLGRRSRARCLGAQIMKVDAVIVGARCAGAATALLLARAGARVLLVDKGVYGSDTMSTHALMRGAVLQLHRWGVLPTIVAAGTPPVHSTTFSYSDAGRHRADRAEVRRQRVVRATPGAARPDAGRCRRRQRSRGPLRCSCRRCDQRRSRARARDHGCRGWHASPHRSRHRRRRGRTALDDRAARGCGPCCRGPALGGSPLQLLGRPSGGRLLLAVPDGGEYRRHSDQRRCHLRVRVGAVGTLSRRDSR